MAFSRSKATGTNYFFSYWPISVYHTANICIPCWQSIAIMHSMILLYMNSITNLYVSRWNRQTHQRLSHHLLTDYSC